MLRFAFLALGLSACSAVVPATVRELSQTNPLEIDPADYAVIAYLPEGLDIAPKGARLRISAQRGADSVAGTYVLTRKALARGGTEFEVAQADLADLRRVQATARQWKAEDPDATNGELSLDVTLCVSGDGPAEGAEFWADMVLEADRPAVPLLRPVPVARYLDGGFEGISAPVACKESS